MQTSVSSLTPNTIKLHPAFSPHPSTWTDTALQPFKKPGLNLG